MILRVQRPVRALASAVLPQASTSIAAAHDGKRGRHLIRCRAHVHLDTDVQFGATRATIGDYLRHDEPHPTDFSVETPWYSLECTFTLEPGAARLPRPPIK